MSKSDSLAAMMQQTMARTLAPEERTIETITGEILDAQRRGGEAILDIGKGLLEAKGMLSHGEWLPWLNEQIGYSERLAQRFMRLAKEYTSNPTALSDLGATKALALLALPAEEREQFVAEHNVVDMTSRQLQQAIKERDEARAAAEKAEADRRSAEEARSKMADDMKVANASLEAARAEREQADDHVRQLEAQLEELKSRPVDVAVETVVDQEAIDKATAEVRAEMKEKLKIARSQRREAEEALAAVQEQLERLRKEDKRAELSSDKDLAQFELLFGQAQETVNKMHGIMLKVKSRDEDAAGRLGKAMKALAEAVGRCAG